MIEFCIANLIRSQCFLCLPIQQKIINNQWNGHKTQTNNSMKALKYGTVDSI